MERRDIFFGVVILFLGVIAFVPNVHQTLVGAVETVVPSLVKGASDVATTIGASPLWQAYGYWLSFFTGTFLTTIFFVRPNIIGKVRGTRQKAEKPHMGGPTTVPGYVITPKTVKPLDSPPPVEKESK